jgi:hypothetical protein
MKIFSKKRPIIVSQVSPDTKYKCIKTKSRFPMHLTKHTRTTKKYLIELLKTLSIELIVMALCLALSGDTPTQQGTAPAPAQPPVVIVLQVETSPATWKKSNTIVVEKRQWK